MGRCFDFRIHAVRAATFHRDGFAGARGCGPLFQVRHCELVDRVKLRRWQHRRRKHRQRDDGRRHLHDVAVDVGEVNRTRRRLGLGVLEALDNRDRHARNAPEERATEDEGSKHDLAQPSDLLLGLLRLLGELGDVLGARLLVFDNDIVQNLELVQVQRPRIVRVHHLEEHPVRRQHNCANCCGG